MSNPIKPMLTLDVILAVGLLALICSGLLFRHYSVQPLTRAELTIQAIDRSPCTIWWDSANDGKVQILWSASGTARWKQVVLVPVGSSVHQVNCN